MHARFDEASAYVAHRRQVLAVLARRCGWLDSSEREAVLHDAYVVMLEKRRRRVLDLGSMSAGQLRAYLIRTAINKALDAGKRAERNRTQPLENGEATLPVPDPRPGPEERAEASHQGAWVRKLIAELPNRQRTIVALRFFVECSPTEIQERLGITRRTYRRQLERAMATICDASSPSVSQRSERQSDRITNHHW